MFERRRISRARYRRRAHLVLFDACHAVTIVDLSLDGALIEPEPGSALDAAPPGSLAALRILAATCEPALTLRATVVRADARGSLALAFGTEPGPARRMLHRTIELGEAGDVLLRRDLEIAPAGLERVGSGGRVD